MSGAFGSDHGHVDEIGRYDLAVMDIETVGKHQGLALDHLVGDGFLIDLGLELIGDQHHDDVGPFGRLGGVQNFKPGLLGSFIALGALGLGDDYLKAAVTQVLGMGVSLAAVADNSDDLILQQCHIRIFFIINLRHGFLLVKFNA